MRETSWHGEWIEQCRRAGFEGHPMSFPYLAETVRCPPRLAKTVRIRRPPAPPPAVARPDDPALRYLVDVTEVVPLPIFFAIGMVIGATGASLLFALIA
jgi:hypothetical protein